MCEQMLFERRHEGAHSTETDATDVRLQQAKRKSVCAAGKKKTEEKRLEWEIVYFFCYFFLTHVVLSTSEMQESPHCAVLAYVIWFSQRKSLDIMLLPLLRAFVTLSARYRCGCRQLTISVQCISMVSKLCFL